MNEREEGQALIETLVLGLVFLVPLLWLLMVLSQVHAGALAVTAAAREAGIDVARSTDRPAASRSLEAAVAQALLDHGLNPRRAKVEWSDGGLGRGSPIEVQISYPIPLLQAPFIGSLGSPSVWIRATHVTHVDPFRDRTE